MGDVRLSDRIIVFGFGGSFFVSVADPSGVTQLQLFAGFFVGVIYALLTDDESPKT